MVLHLSPNVAEHPVGRQLGPSHCRVYALRGAKDLPQEVMPLSRLVRECPWVAFERDTHTRVYDRWMREHLRNATVRLRVDIFNAMAAVLCTH